MTVRITLTLLITLSFLVDVAEISPSQGARLNYTQIMFEWNHLAGAQTYVIQVSEYGKDSSFAQLIYESTDSPTAAMVSNLQFGKKYMWRYRGVSDHYQCTWNGPYIFNIETCTLPDKDFTTFETLTDDSMHNQRGFIINDCTRTVIDRRGNMVWYLPKVSWSITLGKKNIDLKPQIIGLRLSCAGTITYLADSIAAEFDLSGHLLWKAPNDGQVAGLGCEFYNHDFKRLPSGNYMLLGNELWRPLPYYTDTAGIIKKYRTRKVFNNHEYANVEFGTIMEYDKTGKLLWSWNSQDYFNPDPIRPYQPDKESDWDELPHVNAFDADSKDENVYIGFRNVSRILKVEKLTGKVTNSWGKLWPGGEARTTVLFNRQHDAHLLSDSSIAIFNSNDYPGEDSFSRVVIFSTKEADNGKVKWSYNCDFDSLDRHASRNGGNVDQLKNRNYFVCMGNMDRILEITPDKKIVWEGRFKSSVDANRGYTHRLYSSHYISSLYPCYFVFDTNKDTISRKTQECQIRIFNKGSEADAYEIVLCTASGHFHRQITTDEIQPAQSNRYKIRTDPTWRPGDKINILIKSKTNPEFERKSVLVITK